MKQKNYTKFFIIMTLLTTSLITSIRVFYMLEHGVSEGQVATLKGIFSIVVTLTELPTGIIADKFSKKISLAIGAVLFALHAGIYVLMPNYAGFILTQVILAFSSSFISGADAGYLHDYINAQTEDQYVDIAGKIQYWGSYISAGFFLFSGVLYSINHTYNFGFTAFLGCVVFAVICTMPDIKAEAETKAGKKHLVQEYLRDTFGVLQYTFSNAVVVRITLLSAVVTSLLIFNFEYYQILLDKFDFPEKYIGILYASFMLLGGIGAKSSKKLINKMRLETIFSLFIIGISISYLCFAFAKNLWIIFFAIGIQQICFGSWGLIAQNIILENIPSEDVKSTMLSMNSLVSSLFKGIIVIVLGVLLSQTSYKTAYVVMFFIMCITIVITQSRIQSKFR